MTTIDRKVIVAMFHLVIRILMLIPRIIYASKSHLIDAPLDTEVKAIGVDYKKFSEDLEKWAGIGQDK